MKKETLYVFLLLSSCFFSCKTGIKLEGSPTKQLKALRNNAPVVVFEIKDSLPTNQSTTFLGNFKLKDGGTTIDCNYERILQIAKEKARKVGANAIKLTEHKKPSTYWSTCHRIKFQLWKLENTRPYERQLIWSADRELTWKEFQGSPENKAPSFLCGKISAQFQDQNLLTGKGHIHILPIINFDCSWVHADYKTEAQLTYNQVKFDLLEVYTRKMRKAFADAQLESHKKWEIQAPKIYTEIGKAYRKEVDQLDRETYYGTYPMGIWRWSFLTHKKLEDLQQYATGKFPTNALKVKK